ncbi:MAG: N-acetyltransferase family protein [Rhizobiaceae bacterium]|nr:N-acetyltransferase family protein [Rhizobiaceae bacterium]
MTSQKPATPVIDNARLEDIPAITRIYADAVLNGKASFEWDAPDENEMRRRYQSLLDNQFPYLVARLGDKVIGYAYAGPFHNRIGYKWTVENTVYIDPAYHGRGIGTLFLEQLIKTCTDKNFRQMVAVIGDNANEGSIRLHKKSGFIHAGTLKSVGRKHGVWLDSVLMQRSLGPGSGTPPDKE